MKKTYFILFWLSTFTSVIGQNLMSPSAFLGYELGSRFTFHADLERYCDHIVASKPQQFIKLNYGKTEEGRNLFAILHSSNALPSKIENRRINHLKNIGLLEGPKTSENTLISWYSFNIHGDEASSSEAAMAYLFFLATHDIVQEDIVILDPCLNPDGREHYVQWFSAVHLKQSLYHKNAFERSQPWPEGRFNHYLSDLNRDWVWQVQKESQQRLKLYNAWMPHVHADFHEMEPRKSYFFPPPAEPIHEATEAYQKRLLNKIGADLGHVFKEKKWDYFSEKEFDLLYPSYGDTYTTFNGGLGLTLEQGGGDKAGLLFIKENGDSLSLKSRIDKHFEAAKTLQISASKNKREILTNFQTYHLNTLSHGNGHYKEFVLKNDVPAKTKSVTQLLEKLGIVYTYSRENKSLIGFNFQNKTLQNFEIGINDIVVSTYQPKGHLVRVLFEPHTSMKDFKTYDISGWALPYLHHINCYGFSERIDTITDKKPSEISWTTSPSDTSGLEIKWNSPAAVKFLAEILTKKASIRLNALNGATSLVLIKEENKGCFKELTALASQLSLDCNPIHKKTVKNIIKRELPLIKTPRIGVLQGEGFSEEELGDILFYLDKYLSYPFSQISVNSFDRIDYDDFDIIIVSKGDVGKVEFDDDKLKRWLAHGGKLILIQSGLTLTEKLKIGTLNDKNLEEINYSEDRYKPTNLIQGAIFNTAIANHSPLKYGLEDGLNFLMEDIPHYDVLKSKTHHASSINYSNYLGGFVGENAMNYLENSFILGSYYFGNGVIYQFAINPLFRGIMEDGKVLMGNALFLSKPIKASVDQILK